MITKTPNEALMDAALAGDGAAIKQAIADGAPVDTLAYGNTALTLAAKGGYLDAVQTLLEADANVDLQDYHDRSPLHRAANKDNNGAVIIALLEAGADVDGQTKTGYTPLNIAITCTDRDAVNILLAAGADLTVKIKNNKTPVECAHSLNYPGLAYYLQAIADNPALRPTPESVGLNMGKRIAALEALGKPLGQFTEQERKRTKQRDMRAAQRQAALRGEGI